VLGISKEKTQGISLPQRVREIQGPLQILAGPEHAAALTSQSTAYLWGSNEFSQLAVPASSFIVAFRPVILQQLSTKHVIGLACGGSHTLAVVAEGSGNSGTLFAWGTGSVGQLGLGGTVEITDTPSRVTLPSSPACGGKSPLQAVMPYAGIVSSAVVNTAGEVFVWGDASLGRLGLSTVYDSTPPGGVPVLVDASKEWTPKHLPFSLADLGPDAPRNATAPVVVSVAMGGSFSLFLLRPGNKAANIPGCTLLATGAIGIDITKDAYGTIDAATIEADLDREISAIPRRTTPGPIAPFGTQPVILSACAGARHAALVVAEISRGGVPRLYTAGKGWLGHSNDPISNLLPAPKTTTYFAPVSGVLAEEDVIEAACGHSHTIARTPDGRLFSWGRGDSGELGTGSLSDFNMPVPVSSLDGHVYKSVIAGSYYSAATAEPGYAGVRKSPTDVAAAIYATYAKVGGAAAAATGSSASTAKAAAPAPAPEPEENDDPDALPKGWDYDYDDEGNIYFIRPDGETQWEDPRDG
jgi:alpha-tubulin suppressor-like RCC1 family protein